MMKEKTIKIDEETDIKNFKVTLAFLALIVITGVTFLITQIKAVGFLYAVFSIVWFGLEGSIIKSAAKVVLKNNILVAMYTDSSTLLAFATLFYSVSGWTTFWGKFIATLICLVLMTALRYWSNSVIEKAE
ncbi:hypothetical protein COL32_25065 [Bacillus pseudomycoides]|nr:hypothetical protein COL29_01530 [Bacillus pseudomycoides]PFX38537.1 hypothetical protein COL32_25065 [Bacillus pseudomycoides]